MDGAAGAGPSTSPLFERAFALVLDLEGAPTDDPDDAGGPTRYGLSQRYNPDFDGTLASAKRIYRRKYWDGARCDDLPPALALVVFDCAVIPGLGWVAGALQALLHIEQDGIIGVHTVPAARNSGWQLVLALTERRLAEFERDVRIHPINQKYALGWRVRALRTFREAVKLEAV